MLYLHLSLILAAASAAAVPGDTITAGGDRPVVVHVPPSYDPAVPAPLLLLLHGYGPNADYIEPWLKFLPLAAERGILFAAPRGTKNFSGLYFWNATDSCCAYTDSPDDSGYLRGLIEELRGLLVVDPDRIYVVGHSNGGFMGHRLACDHPDLVAAVVSFAGATYRDPARCAAAHPVHVLQVHGTDDRVVFYDGNARRRYPGAEATAAQWAAKNDCAPEPDRTEAVLDLDAELPGLDTRIDRHDRDCAAGGSAELWTIEGGRHAPVWSEDGSSTNFAAAVLDWLLRHPKEVGPEAAFTVSPAVGPAPLAVTADASASAAPADTSLAAYRWDFGGGAAGDSATASHTYARAGRYWIGLRVAAADGRLSRTARRPVQAVCPGADTTPWVQAHVGVPLVRGSARFADEDPRDLILCAGGAGFAERGDDGFFLHQKAGGACRLTARIAELAGGGAGARIGLACRESLAAGSRFAGIFLSGGTGGRRLEFGSRAPALAFTGGGEEPSPDAGWLRLERRGDRVRGLASADGVAWTPLGEVEIAALPTTLLLGIAAAGGDADPAASFEAFSARIAAVELLPLASQSTFRRGDASGDGKVDVTDCLRILNHLFRGGPAPACGDAADGNDSGAVDVSDAIAIFDFLFHGTRPDLPPPGHASCGDDPTADALGCAGFQEGCGE